MEIYLVKTARGGFIADFSIFKNREDANEYAKEQAGKLTKSFTMIDDIITIKPQKHIIKISVITYRI